MGSDWKLGRLRDIADVVMGQSPTADYVNESWRGKPLLNGPTEFGPMHPTPVQFTTDVRKKANPGDLLFCVRGSTTGRMNWADQEYAIGRGLAAIRHRDGDTFQHFVRAAIELKLPELLAAATGSTFPNVGRDQLLDIPASIPPKGYQQLISRFFKGIDEKIDINRRINQTLEAMAQAIFKSWFVDFDPVKAKLATKAALTPALSQREREEMVLRAAMRAISGKTDTELDALPTEHYEQLATTAALFPDEMVDSELGEIPKGWSVSKVEALLSRLSAKTRYTKDQVSEYGKIPVFEQGALILLGYHNGAAAYQASSENPIFIFGDHTCATRLSCQPFDISQNVIPLQGKDRATTWVYYAVKEKQRFQEYRRHWMELISKDVVIADADICLEFSKVISIFHVQIEANEQQIKILRELRDTLLPKLLSGELAVSSLDACGDASA